MAKVYVDCNRYTCISYVECDGVVLAVRMQEPELGLLEMDSVKFHSQWTEIVADPIKAATQYRDGLIPFNSEVSDILESIIMATAKNAAKKPSKAVVTDGEGKPKAAAKKTTAAAEAKAKAFFDKAEKAAGVEGADTKPAKSKGKAKAEAAEPKEKKERAPRAPKEDISDKKIVLLPLPEGKRFNEGSVRAQCFAKIKDGMTVKAFLAAVTKAGICEEKAAVDNLKKLINPAQKYPAVQLA